MRKFVSLLVLSLVTAPAFAVLEGDVPEPESLALLAMGVVGLLVARRKK